MSSTEKHSSDADISMHNSLEASKPGGIAGEESPQTLCKEHDHHILHTLSHGVHNLEAALCSHDLNNTMSNVDFGAAETILMSDCASLREAQKRTSATAKDDPNDGSQDVEAQQLPTPQFDRGYAWVVLAASTVINAFSWGASGSFGVFLATFLSTNQYPGARKIDFAFVGGLQFGVGLMVSPFVIQAIRKLPFKLVIVAGAFVQAGAYIAASFATRMWHLYLSQGLLNGIGIGMVFITANAAIPLWFAKRRGMANGIFTAGSGIGSIIFSLSVQALIDRVGLHWAQRYVGLMTFGFCIVSGLFVKEQKGVYRKKVKAYSVALLRRPDLWIAMFWGVITLICYGIVLYTMAPYAVSIGLSHHQGSVLSAVLSAGIVVGRPLMGHVGDMIGSVNVSLITTLLSTLFIFAWWIPSKSYGSLIVLSFLLGGLSSAFSAGFPPICASLVELEDLSAMLSMSWTVIGAIGIFSTPIAIGLTTADGSYLYSQIFTGILYVVASVMLLFIRGIQFRNKQTTMDKSLADPSNSVNEKQKKGIASFASLMFKVEKV